MKIGNVSPRWFQFVFEHSEHFESCSFENWNLQTLFEKLNILIQHFQNFICLVDTEFWGPSGKLNILKFTIVFWYPFLMSKMKTYTYLTHFPTDRQLTETKLFDVSMGKYASFWAHVILPKFESGEADGDNSRLRKRCHRRLIQVRTLNLSNFKDNHEKFCVRFVS